MPTFRGKIRIGVLIIVVVGICLAALYGLLKPISNGCVMTYMYPTYIPITSMESVTPVKYGLYLYHEGWKKIDYREHVKKLSGVPVLFIPGNGGSYKQVRSLAAESDRAYQNGPLEYSFYQEASLTPEEGDADISLSGFQLPNQYTSRLDWFAVDLEGEHSAMDGAILEEHAEYVVYAIHKILDQYKVSYDARTREGAANSGSLPKSVILVGHSMGGFVARAAVVHPHLRKSAVQTILTLSSPHQSPPVAMQPSLGHYFSRVNSEWREGYKAKTTNTGRFVSSPVLSDVVVVSISGAYNDYQVRSKLTSLDNIVPPTHGFMISSTAMKNVWLSMEHQAIMWCNQLVVQVSHTLLSLTDARTGQPLSGSRKRLEVFARMLHSGISHDFNRMMQLPSSKQSINIPDQNTKDDSGPQKHRSVTCPHNIHWNDGGLDRDLYIQINEVTVLAMDGRRRWLDIQKLGSNGKSHFVLVTNLEPCSGIRLHLWPEKGSSASSLPLNDRVMEVTSKMMRIPSGPAPRQPEPGSQTEQPPPSAVFWLGPEDMHGFRYLTISVAPRPSVSGRPPPAASMAVGQFFKPEEGNKDLSPWFLLQSTYSQKELLLEEAHPLAVKLSFSISLGLLPITLSMNTVGCGIRNSGLPEEEAGDLESSRLCKLRCFPPVALAWDDISGLHIYPNLNSETILVDSSPAQWSSTQQSDKTIVLMLVDPHCSYKSSISISVGAAASRFLLFLTLTYSVLAQLPPFACDYSNPSTRSYPFCNPKLPITQRTKDLVSRLTLDEKLAQLVNSAPPIPRLGIPAYEWWSEALHGIGNVGRGIFFNGSITSATSFPQVILTAASFDSHLWYRIGQAIGVEARAIYNGGQAMGMTFWAPNINIFRDPRWGRGQETAGEDPMMTSNYAVSYVRGLQGDSFQGGKLRGHLQASACCKHFTAYDLDNWKGVNRFHFDARVSLQDLADTYQPPFRSCIEQGRASGIMCAYNRVNGIPSCADFNLLTNTVRKQWEFHGYIVSDCGAVGIIHDEQGYAKSAEDAVADVLHAGMDLECGSYLTDHAKSAVQQKKLPIVRIDRALHNLFSIRIRLGQFDGNPAKLPFGMIGPNHVCSENHLYLALEAARNGIVLLKNTASLLPLPKTSISLAVIGPNANASPLTLLGNYAGPPCKSITILQGFQHYVKNAVFHPGCDGGPKCASAPIDKAVKVAKNADYVVLVMGLDQSVEREERDRVHLDLPGKQLELINSVAKASKRPVILVLLCGGPIDISSAKNNDKIGGIIWAGYPGELGGIALAQIIFGDHNPGGRLPITWYPKDYIKVPMTDMRMRADPTTGYPGRTYRFYKGPTVYEFGHGLSYTKYSYEFVSVTHDKLHFNQSSTHLMTENSETIRYKLVSELDEETCKSMSVSVTVGVKNHGNIVGRHPILLFMRPQKHRTGSPMKQLVGFHSLLLDAGEMSHVGFELSPCEHLSRANEAGLKIIEEGSHLLHVGEEEYLIDIIV